MGFCLTQIKIDWLIDKGNILIIKYVHKIHTLGPVLKLNIKIFIDSPPQKKIDHGAFVAIGR